MSEAEKKRRFAVVRFDERRNFYLEIAQVFETVEEAKSIASESRTDWAVFQLDELVDGENYITNKNRIILPFVATTESIHGGEVIYHRESSLWNKERMKLSPLDSAYYMTVIDYAGKEEAKEDFVVAFYPYKGEWRYEWKSHDTGQKAGWNGDEYLVKIQLPVNREVPRAN